MVVDTQDFLLAIATSFQVSLSVYIYLYLSVMYLVAVIQHHFIILGACYMNTCVKRVYDNVSKSGVYCIVKGVKVSTLLCSWWQILVLI